MALVTEALAMDPKSKSWRVKPKLQLFCSELVEFVAPFKGSPKSFWTYRDEDFRGLVGTGWI